MNAKFLENVKMFQSNWKNMGYAANHTSTSYDHMTQTFKQTKDTNVKCNNLFYSFIFSHIFFHNRQKKCGSTIVRPTKIRITKLAQHAQWIICEKYNGRKGKP